MASVDIYSRKGVDDAISNKIRDAVSDVYDEVDSRIAEAISGISVGGPSSPASGYISDAVGNRLNADGTGSRRIADILPVPKLHVSSISCTDGTAYDIVTYTWSESGVTVVFRPAGADAPGTDDPPDPTGTITVAGFGNTRTLRWESSATQTATSPIQWPSTVGTKLTLASFDGTFQVNVTVSGTRGEMDGLPEEVVYAAVSDIAPWALAGNPIPSYGGGGGSNANGTTMADCGDGVWQMCDDTLDNTDDHMSFGTL